MVWILLPVKTCDTYVRATKARLVMKAAFKLKSTNKKGSHGKPHQFTLTQPIHSDTVTALAPIRCGLVISGGCDKKVIVSNYETGQEIRSWQGHEKDVTKLCYYDVPGKQYVVSGSRDTTLRAWNFASSDCHQILNGHSYAVTGVAVIDVVRLSVQNKLHGRAVLGSHAAVIVSDGKVVSGSRDNTLRVWNIETGECIQVAKQTRNLVTHLSWSKNANVLAQTSEDKELKLWDVNSMTVVHTFPMQQYIQTNCEVDPAGQYCLSCSNGFNSSGCFVTIWDLRQRKMLAQLTGHEQSVNAACFVPPAVNRAQNRQLIVSVSSDHTARLWDLETAKLIWTETIPSGGSLLSVISYGDGAVVAGGHHACLTNMSVVTENAKTYLQPVSLQILANH